MHPETERMMHFFVLEFHFHLIGTRRERTETRFFHVCRNYPTVKLAVKLLRVARKLFWAGRKKGPFKGILSSRSLAPSDTRLFWAGFIFLLRAR